MTNRPVSARFAWHDATFRETPPRFGIASTGGWFKPILPLPDKYKPAIYRAIKSLPPYLQRFGDYCYGSVWGDEAHALHQSTCMHIYDAISRKKMTLLQRSHSYFHAVFLVGAALEGHRNHAFKGGSAWSAANDRGDNFRQSSVSSAKVAKFVLDRYKHQLDTSNWCKASGPLFDAFLEVIDDMERKALKPVAEALTRLEESAA